MPQVPWLGVADTNSIPDGKKSLRPTSWGSELFVTVMVKVYGCPTVAGLGSGV